jgi:hypothetical protein
MLAPSLRHGLGNALAPHQPTEIWAEQAGMEWEIRQAPVRFMTDTINRLSTVLTFAEHQVLYRSDTRAPLAVVGRRFQVVQPRAILEFYRDLTSCPATNWKRRAFSRAAGGCGPWPKQESRPR